MGIMVLTYLTKTAARIIGLAYDITHTRPRTHSTPTILIRVLHGHTGKFVAYSLFRMRLRLQINFVEYEKAD